MAQDVREFDAISGFLYVLQVRRTDATGFHPDQQFACPDLRNRDVFQP
jgi:hypothetical protein